MENKILKSILITFMHMAIIWAICILLIWPMISLVTYHYPTCLDNANVITWQSIYLLIYSLLAGIAAVHIYYKAYIFLKK